MVAVLLRERDFALRIPGCRWLPARGSRELPYGAGRGGCSLARTFLTPADHEGAACKRLFPKGLRHDRAHSGTFLTEGHLYASANEMQDAVLPFSMAPWTVTAF